jgi:two-component system nitrate/nitrite sensor histidine kinase NarX
VLEIVQGIRLAWPLAVLVLCLLFALLLVLIPGSVTELAGSKPVLSLLLGAAILSLLVGMQRLRNLLLAPLAWLKLYLTHISQGEPIASLRREPAGILGPLARDIDSLSEELTDLYEDMDNRVARQTQRLAQKTASLKILYDVAASINDAYDLDELLLRFLRVLKEMVNGRTAKVILMSADGRMRLVGCIDASDMEIRSDQMLPVRLCHCGAALTPADIRCEQDAVECSRINARQMWGSDLIDKILVPLEYHSNTLGHYEIYVEKPGISGREDIMELLATIGNHLGMAVAKQRSDAEARRLSIVEERNNLAHELHDSLAQTLASLRFQVRMLAETLEQQCVAHTAQAELERIRNGLDEAHTELRELLNSFRAPLDQRGLIPALDKLVSRFREETGISTFLQCDCRQLHLSTPEEMQMLRIIQEALANIRKHAKAQTVRVLLRCLVPGQYILLVEDDGAGFESPVRVGHPGEHIGLSIMEERARRLGAVLRVESEPGEGTRVELTFRPAERLRG